MTKQISTGRAYLILVASITLLSLDSVMIRSIPIDDDIVVVGLRAIFLGLAFSAFAIYSRTVGIRAPKNGGSIY